MLGRRPRKSPQAKTQAGAAAKQLGLFVEFNPEEMVLDLEDDGDLEAELAAITGENLPAGKTKQKGKAPLPMDQIEKMAAECMKDVDEEDDEGLEEDTELLAELQEVLGEEDEGENKENESETMEVSPATTEQNTDVQTQMTPAVSNGLQKAIEERIANYKAALLNAKEVGENARVRRYERGLKTLEAMLTALKKGKKVNEQEMPPPVASGKSSLSVPQTMRRNDLSEVSGDELTASEEEGKEDLSAAHKLNSPSDLDLNRITLPSQDVNTDVLGTKATIENNSKHLGTRALLLTREKEYKLAALRAKQKGDLEKAKGYMRTGKKFSLVLEALDSGQPIDLTDMPPALEELESPENVQLPSIQTPSGPVETSQLVIKPDPQAYEDSGSLQQPKTVLEALQQRLEKYRSAAAQAKANGDGRKSRMHERIAKQYQDAIRAHKAGRKVNFSELPVPPGFPPIPGIASTDNDGTVAGVLENANRLVKMEEEEGGEPMENDKDHDDNEVPAAKKPTQLPTKPLQIVQPLEVPSSVIQEEPTPEKDHSLPSPVMAPEKSASIEHLPSAAREHLEFLENRKKQYLKAAIQAKKKNDLEDAKAYLRTAKSLDPKIEMAKNGKLVDISKLPSPPTDDEGDFIFIHHEDVRLSQKVEEVYIQLLNLLKDQHEKCMQYSKQFMHLGNVMETSRFEKLAQNCKKDLDILQLAQKQGLDPPCHHFEERTFKIVRIFSELSSTEMHLIIVRGINLPAPSGVAPNDLDAFVKFEFPYPNTEQAQKSKTSVIKNTNCPEYNQLFKLNINRNHRGFRRAVQSKGIKFEIFHKGSFFRSDKQVGIAHLKLHKLESECEVREIIELLDNRKPTGGKLEVKVRLREPLTGQDLQTITENWLVLEH